MLGKTRFKTALLTNHSLASLSLTLLAIYTSAMDMLGGAGVEKQCRKTDILADAAYCILTKPKSFTGNFVIDENLLREEGVKNFDAYAVAPGNLHSYVLHKEM